MDLVQIRDMVLRRAPTTKIDDIDDMLNMVQRQDIQPLAKKPGIVNHIKAGPETVSGEANALDVTGTIYTTTYSPLLPGAVTVKVNDDAKETDDAGFEHTIDYEAGLITFDATQAGNEVTVDYTTEDSIRLTSLASDIYQITAIKQILTGGGYGEIPFLPYDDADSFGIRLYNDRLYFQGVTEGTALAFHYWKALSELGTASGQVTTPEIDARWHDLYWLGALAMLLPEKWLVQFDNRLEAYKRDIIDRDNPRGLRRQPMQW